MPIEKDRYGRTVAEVFVKQTNSQEETFVNGELVSLLLHKMGQTGNSDKIVR